MSDMNARGLWRTPTTAIFGIAFVIASLGSLTLVSVHHVWWGITFAFVTLTAGLILEIRRAHSNKRVTR